MGAPKLADVLMDFGGRRDILASLTLASLDEVDFSKPVAETGPDVATLIADAESAVTARLTSDYEEAMQALRDAHREEIARIENTLWASTTALIEERFAMMETSVLEQTGVAVARTLGSALSGNLQTRAIRSLVTSLQAALRNREITRLRVTGPLQLFEALKKQLGPGLADFDFTESSDIDLTVTIDNALYATRIGDWGKELSQVLE